MKPKVKNVFSDEKNRKVILIAIGALLAVIVAIFLFKTFTDSTSANNMQIHQQLEVLEIQIRQNIKNGKEAEALELIQQLNHPGEELMPNDGSIETFLKGSPSYKFYWMEKKRYYINKALQ
jgi:uncharacterized membrane protein YeiB